MPCEYCNKRVVLVPSAAERSKKFGQPASFYTRLFKNHAACELKAREQGTKELMARLSGKKARE